MQVKNPELKRKMRKLKASKPSWGTQHRQANQAMKLYKRAKAKQFLNNLQAIRDSEGADYKITSDDLRKLL